MQARSAREIAATIVMRVTEEEGWVSRLLDTSLGELSDSRDARLTTAIVYGSVRALPALDRLLKPFLKKPHKLDRFALALLRTATFQLAAMERVPTHAVVNESVRIAKRRRGPRVAGLVNAVLRRVAESLNGEIKHFHLELPTWLGHELKRDLGRDRFMAYIKKYDRVPPLDLRVIRGDVDSHLKAFEEAGLSPMRIEAAPAAIRVEDAGDPRSLPGYELGQLMVQELGAQIIVDLIDAEKGMHVADVCAGRGGKTIPLLARFGSDIELSAFELHEFRLEQIPGAAERVGLDRDAIRLECVDFSVGNGDFDACFDRVLVDAPCSGLGTLERRPEILLRVSDESLDELVELQAKIFAHAWSMVKPGGVMTFAVCSPLAREMPQNHSQDAEMIRLSGADDDGVLRIGAWSEVISDGYQICAWRKLPG